MKEVRQYQPALYLPLSQHISEDPLYIRHGGYDRRVTRRPVSEGILHLLSTGDLPYGTAIEEKHVDAIWIETARKIDHDFDVVAQLIPAAATMLCCQCVSE